MQSYTGVSSALLGGDRIPFREAVKRLCTMVEPMTRRLGSVRYLDGGNRILDSGTGSDFLRNRYNAEQNLKKVTESLQGEFWR